MLGKQNVTINADVLILYQTADEKYNYTRQHYIKFIGHEWNKDLCSQREAVFRKEVELY